MAIKSFRHKGLREFFEADRAASDRTKPRDFVAP
jgi:hypothetical protein